MSAKRKSRFVIRLTDAEMNRLNEQVSKTYLNREAFVRHLINGDILLETPLKSEDYRRILKSLDSIVTSFHQIAIIAQKQKYVQEHWYKENYEELSKLCTELRILPRWARREE